MVRRETKRGAISPMVECVVAPESGSRRWRGILLVAGAAAAWSIAGVIARLTVTDAWTTLFWRSIFAALFLTGYILWRERGDWRGVLGRLGWAGTAIAVSFAGSMICFILALGQTTVANVLFIQATAPFFAAAGAWLLMRERIAWRTVVAMGLALTGVAIMVSGGSASGRIGGDLLSVVMTIGMAVAIVLGRRHRDVEMTTATCLACVIVAVVTAPLATPLAVSRHDLVLLVIFGIGQMGLALIMFSAGVQLIPAAEAGLVSVLETVLAPIWVWLAVGEVPGRPALTGGAVVMAAVLGHALTDWLGERRRQS
jgi:drug/metabolite transporter (DMT)-like permease